MERRADGCRHQVKNPPFSQDLQFDLAFSHRIRQLIRRLGQCSCEARFPGNVAMLRAVLEPTSFSLRGQFPYHRPNHFSSAWDDVRNSPSRWGSLENMCCEEKVKSAQRWIFKYWHRFCVSLPADILLSGEVVMGWDTFTGPFCLFVLTSRDPVKPTLIAAPEVSLHG